MLSGNEVIMSIDKVSAKQCRNGSWLIRSRNSGWKFFHPAKMVTVGEGLIVVSFGIAWQFYISRSEKQADGTWQDVESKTVTPAQLSDYFDGRETLHHPDPLPAHVDVTIPEELIDDCD